MFQIQHNYVNRSIILVYKLFFFQIRRLDMYAFDGDVKWREESGFWSELAAIPLTAKWVKA